MVGRSESRLLAIARVLSTLNRVESEILLQRTNAVAKPDKSSDSGLKRLEGQKPYWAGPFDLLKSALRPGAIVVLNIIADWFSFLSSQQPPYPRPLR